MKTNQKDENDKTEDDQKKYSYSFYEDGIFLGSFKSLDEALIDAKHEYSLSYDEPLSELWIGESREAVSPESLFSTDVWLDNVCCQDDYCVDGAEDWYQGNKEQERELEDKVSKVIGKWLDKHKLRSNHWVVDNIKRVAV